MNNIADQIIAKNDSLPPRPKIFADITFDSEVDELGIPTSQIDDYLIARILMLDNSREEHLYVKNGDVYQGREKIRPTSTNLIRLARWRYPLKTHLVPWLWDRLKEVLPEYSRDKLVVAPGVTWDRANGVLTDEKEMTI